MRSKTGRKQEHFRDEGIAKLVFWATIGDRRHKAEEIYTALGMSRATLFKLYKKELHDGNNNIQVETEIFQTLWQMKDWSPAVAIFLAKTILKLRETDTVKVEHSGEIAVKHPTPEFKVLSPEEWQATFAKPQIH